MRKIVLISHSLAFTSEDGTIYLNKHLKGKLKEQILKHEMSHTIGKYNDKDYKLDKENNISQWQIFKFCLRHPLAFCQLSPITKVGNKIFYRRY